MQKGRASQKAILVVDDQKSVYESFCAAFLNEEYNIFYTKNCSSAKRLLNKGTSIIDLAVVDIMMPGESGLDLLLYVRQAFPLLPVIILSGYGGEEALQACRTAFKSGAADYLKKPVSADAFRSAVEGIFDKSKIKKLKQEAT